MLVKSEVLYFLGDNMLAQISEHTTAEIQNNGFIDIRLPSSSPDINPI